MQLVSLSPTFWLLVNNTLYFFSATDIWCCRKYCLLHSCHSRYSSEHGCAIAPTERKWLMSRCHYCNGQVLVKRLSAGAGGQAGSQASPTRCSKSSGHRHQASVLVHCEDFIPRSPTIITTMKSNAMPHWHAGVMPPCQVTSTHHQHQSQLHAHGPFAETRALCARRFRLWSAAQRRPVGWHISLVCWPVRWAPAGDLQSAPADRHLTTGLSPTAVTQATTHQPQKHDQWPGTQQTAAQVLRPDNALISVRFMRTRGRPFVMLMGVGCSVRDSLDWSVRQTGPGLTAVSVWPFAITCAMS